MNPNNFGDPLTFHVAPPACQFFTYPVKYLYIYEMDWHHHQVKISNVLRFMTTYLQN